MLTKTILPSILLSVFLFSVISCSKNETQAPDITFHHENSSLEVWVREQSDTGLVDAVGAVVSLYESDLYRTDRYRPTEGTTGEDGKYTFISLAKDKYWIAVEYDGTVKWIFENAPYDTPGHPVILNKLEVDFDD